MFYNTYWRPASLIKTKYIVNLLKQIFLNREDSRSANTNSAKMTKDRSSPKETLKKEENQYEIAPSSKTSAAKRFFLVNNVSKEEEFFQGYQTTPKQESLTFWLQSLPAEASPMSEITQMPLKFSFPVLHLSQKRRFFWTKQLSKQYESPKNFW